MRKRDLFFRNELGRIEHVELELIGEVFVEHLHAQFPFREIAGGDGLPEIAAVEVGIGAVDLDRFVPARPIAGRASASSEI